MTVEERELRLQTVSTMHAFYVATQSENNRTQDFIEDARGPRGTIKDTQAFRSILVSGVTQTVHQLFDQITGMYGVGMSLVPPIYFEG